MIRTSSPNSLSSRSLRSSPMHTDNSNDTPTNLQLFERLYSVLLHWIICRARRLAEGDRDLQDDLIQTGLCAIWELCTPTVTTLDLDDVRTEVHRAMLHFRRAERRAGIIGPQPSRDHVRTAGSERHVAIPSTNPTSTTR